MKLTKKEIAYEGSSLIDPVGRIFYFNNKVYRYIYDRYFADLYQDVLADENIEKLFQLGLVRTKICDEVNVSDAALILEHEKIPFILRPQEYTNKMFYDSICMFLDVCLHLSKSGYVLKDAHPYNFSYKNAKPIFYDFGSITKGNEIPPKWLEELISYCIIPIYLSSKRRFNEYSIEYRREHLYGFGRKVLSKDLVKKNVFKKLYKLEAKRKNPTLFYEQIIEWLRKHKPIEADEQTWGDYQQNNNQTADSLKPVTIKQKFIYDIISKECPKRVVDFAANKGFYSEMAARLGADVLAFDYEETLVNDIRRLAKEKQLNITPAYMDFLHPTPPSGVGLVVKSSFDRFKSEIGLALGLIHHLTYHQNMPVNLFCDLCMQYAEKGIILEYIDSEDKYVKNWNKPTPKDYSLEKIQEFFSVKFPHMKVSEPHNQDGVIRCFAFFYKD